MISCAICSTDLKQIATDNFYAPILIKWMAILSRYHFSKYKNIKEIRLDRFRLFVEITLYFLSIEQL